MPLRAILGFVVGSLLLAPTCGLRAANYVVAWGFDIGNRLSVPAGLTNVVAVGASDSNLALRNDGSVVGWGDNPFANVPSEITNVTAIGVGEYHGVALSRNGTVLAWGDNNLGQTNIPAGLTNVAAVSAGWAHSLVLCSNGTLAAWGYSDSGRTSIPPGLSNVIAISAGGGHNLAVRSDGTVAAWGFNCCGQTNVPPGLSNVLSVAAGGSHSVAIRQDHSLVAWGDNSYGKTNVPSDLTNVVAVSAGENFNLAIKSDGTVAAWGWGNNLSRTAEVPPGLTNVIAVAAGRFHSLAVAVVNDGAPIVTRHPSYQYVYSGMPASFEIRAEGSPVPSCQWQFNGANIAGATDFSLQLSNIQLTNAGKYRAVLNNSHGTAVSLAADLEVVNDHPWIQSQPRNQVVYQGTDCSLTVGVIGSWPLRYQWALNGTNISGATDSALSLSPAQKSQTGSYLVVITNSFGSVTSTPAAVVVFNLADALNTNLNWNTFGDAPWFGENQSTDYVIPAARSGSITNNQSSTIQTTVTGPGTLTFDWKVSSEASHDGLIFSIDGAEQKAISGETYWTSELFYLGAGSHTLRWAYVKDASGSAGQDAGWLHWVSYTNGATLPVITTQPVNQALAIGSNFTFTANGYGTPPLTWRWEKNGSPIPGATSSSLAILNAQAGDEAHYRAILSNPYGSIASTEAALFTSVGPPQQQDALDRWFLRSSVLPSKVRFILGNFIAVGTNGLIMTSPDGRTWTRQNSGTTADLKGAAGGTLLNFFQSLVVVVGEGGTILTSPDLTNWTSVSATSQDLNDVAFNGFSFVASTAAMTPTQPNVLCSADGIHWGGARFPSNPDSGLPFYTTAVGLTGSAFVTAGGSQFAYYIWRSTNGTNWVNVGFSDQMVQGIASGNSRTLMVGWEAFPRMSTNFGLNWIVVGSPILYPPGSVSPMIGSDITFGNGTFLIPRGFSSGFATTTDGYDWRQRDLFPGSSMQSVAFGKGTFVATCGGGAYPAGIYQSEPVSTPALSIQRLNATTNLLTISGEVGRQYRLQSSTDLTLWTDVNTWSNTASQIQFFAPVSSGAQRVFYRAKSP